MNKARLKVIQNVAVLLSDILGNFNTEEIVKTSTLPFKSKGGETAGLCCAGPDGPVVSVAASRYFSAQVTADGRVWTYGGGFNGELGGAGSSWLSAARPVDGPIAEV